MRIQCNVLRACMRVLTAGEQSVPQGRLHGATDEIQHICSHSTFPVHRSGGLAGHLVFSAALVRNKTAQRMTEHFSTLLAGVAASPQERISRLPLMSPDEHTLTLHTFNATDAPIRPATVHSVFEAIAAAQPEACCLVGAASELSYGEVWAAWG